MQSQPVREPVAIIGAGGHCHVVVSIICATMGEQYVEGIYDDRKEIQGSIVCGKTVKKTSEIIGNNWAVVAIGSNIAREKVVKRFASSLRWATLVHPTAWICKDVKIGAGSVVCAGAIVQPGASVGAHVILNTGCRVDHHCKISEYVHIAPSSTLCGNVCVKAKSFVGAGSVVRQGIVIERESVIGCGSVVVKNVSAGLTVIGVPSRPIAK